MYLEHFSLTKLPFSLTPNTEFFCQLPAYQAALDVLGVSLKNGEGFIKIIGEVGSGKTLLCRKLLNILNEQGFITAYIPNPDLTPAGLRKSLALELGVVLPPHYDQNQLLEYINQRLLQCHSEHKQVVVVIDEAQALSESCLEAIRLLTNLETESHKLLQVVLFGQPELEQRLQQISLRQLRQRITFSYQLPLLKRHELDDYIAYRLTMAGYHYGNLFSRRASQLIYRASAGLPRIVNILCHKAMLVAYGRGQKKVDQHAVKLAILDSQDIVHHSVRWWRYAWSLPVLFGSGFLLLHYHTWLVWMHH